MSKYMTEHASYEAFDEKQENLATPHVSKIDYRGTTVVGFKTTSDNEFHFYQGGEKVTPVPGTLAGDIAYIDAENNKKTCRRDEWSDSLGTPIGVVIVPSSHRADNKSIIMSLCNMSLKTPEVGTLSASAVEGDNYMMWGKYGVHINGLTAHSTIPLLQAEADGQNGTLVEGSWGFVPSDIWKDRAVANARMSSDGVSSELTYEQAFVKSLDGKALRMSDAYIAKKSWPGVSLSPYAADGVSKNPRFESAGACLVDNNGYSNTQAIVAAIADSYKSGATVSNEQDAYPAANCVNRFHTTGTAAGDWYLPSVAEQAYIVARANEIKQSLIKLGNKAVRIGDASNTGYGTWNWSSSEYSSNSAWSCYTDYCRLVYNAKLGNYHTNRVRAVCAF